MADHNLRPSPLRHSRYHSAPELGLELYISLLAVALIPSSRMAQATLEDVQRAADKLGFVVPKGHAEQYAELLSKTEQACLAILAEEGGSRLHRLHGL